MARVAPASDSFWAMPQAMLRLLARPKTTATLPFRSIMMLFRSCWSPLVRIAVLEVSRLHLSTGESIDLQFASIFPRPVNPKTSYSAGFEANWSHEANRLSLLPSWATQNAETAGYRPQDSPRAAPASEQLNQVGGLSGGRDGKRTAQNLAFRGLPAKGASFRTLQHPRKPCQGNYHCHKPSISEVYGGDDGARTRDLCRDRAAL
jgi:hypothetical protein